MELSNVSVEALIAELNGRCTHGVAAVILKETGCVEAWWGDRLKCLGLTTRLSYSVQRELDDMEDCEDEETEDLADEFSQLGMYL